ncbi:MAG: tRNA glutamyl-Q(34) synthetase GluQRS [Thiotrichales bacterium]
MKISRNLLRTPLNLTAPRDPATYIGRFAPSPTGPLHLGSLVAALGSYLDARAHDGLWHLRIEDLDPPREMPGAADSIRRTLERHGLFWDGPVCYQSTHTEAYLDALEHLHRNGLLYPCACTRKTLEHTAQPGAMGPIYPGTCRTRRIDPTHGAHALRVQTDDTPIAFVDRRCGQVVQRLARELGDFVLRRADGLFAYQLAVVVDDAALAITDIVRGADLLDNTPRQIYLQRLLGHPTPRYAHLPIVTHANGEKLSKQTHAPALDDRCATANLLDALAFLGFEPPAELSQESCEGVLNWALSCDWRAEAFQGA